MRERERDHANLPTALAKERSHKPSTQCARCGGVPPEHCPLAVWKKRDAESMDRFHIPSKPHNPRGGLVPGDLEHVSLRTVKCHSAQDPSAWERSLVYRAKDGDCMEKCGSAGRSRSAAPTSWRLWAMWR